MTSRTLVLLLSLAAAFAQPTATLPSTINTYCAGCHNGTTKGLAGNTLDKFDPANISSSPELWTRVLRQLQAGTMPPLGSPRPDRATYERTIATIDRELAISLPPPDPGHVLVPRLAALLWNQPPDAALMQDAPVLRDFSSLVRQVKRMLADPKAEAFITRFFEPWLQLDTLSKTNPDPKLYPDYSPALKEAMQRETTLFLLSQVREDRDPLDLWTADYTFVNERLAKHYNIPDITGPEFRRVAWNNPERAGLLAQGGILTLTSNHTGGPGAAYTSPASRAKWVLFHFLGTPTPTPFPGAQPVKPELPITPQTRTLADNPCVSCHRNFFPLGYGLEHFDPIGRSRTNDSMGPADASGKLVDGTPFSNAAELRQALLPYSDAFRVTLTERLLAYAEGKPVKPLGGTPDTLRTARRILADHPNAHWSTLIAAIVHATH